MKKYFILVFILCSSLFSDIISPEHNSTLSYKHVLFEWEQVPSATSYTVTIYHETSGEYITDTVESLIYINDSFLNWNSSYTWYVTPIFSDGTIGSSIEDSNGNTYFTLHIGQTRSNAYAINYNSSQYSNGITMFSSFFDYYSAAIDENGDEIWNSGDENIIFYNTNYYGNYFGAKLDNSTENYLPVNEYNLDNQILWQENGNHFSHHDMIKLPNGNYLSIVEDIIDGPIPPSVPQAFLFQLLGYQVDGITNEFPWVGDRIVEWDKTTKEEVWSWSTHDYFNKSDYDEIGSTWNAAFDGGRFDWTHANAIAYSEEDDAIFLSSRHLSRITKIDRTTGNIIWNLGLDMISGDVDCGHDIGMSFQHSIQVLENGNIVTLDNGNLSQQINETPFPTSRALEIQIDELNNSCDATVIWSYDLPEELFGFASGNVQKLDNGNYLATTVGDGGTSLEISNENEIIWEGKYNLSLPNGAVYRANRLSSLHPIAFSVIIPNLTSFDLNGEMINGIEYNGSILDIEVYNNGSLNEIYCISNTNNCSEIYPNSMSTFSIDIIEENLSFEVIPQNRNDLSKTFNLFVNNLPECETGFSYFDLSDIPNSTIVLDGAQCFSDIDLDVLNDIISINNLDIDSPIALGTQNWFNGKITRLLIGNYYDGGNITLTTLPESIGDFQSMAMLYLNYNELTSLPNSITQLSNLVYLVLNFNQITSLPENIGDLSNLIWIDLGYNSLEYIPESIGNLDIMSYFWIFNNNLTTLPDSICNLNIDFNGLDGNFLPYFGCGGNQLCGELPECIANSDNFNTSIDPLYYSFLITVEQDCSISCNLLDVNDDGVINVMDIILTINIIIGQVQPSDQESCAADSNGDLIINVLDIIEIVNTIISE